MTAPGSVEPGDRPRLFCALRLPDEVVEALVHWQAASIEAGRVVPPENLHVTLAFLGRRARDELDAIVGALRDSAAAARPIRLEAVRYRETRSVGMLSLSDQGGAATALADELHGRLESLGVYRREAREWLPHVTVVRFRERPRLDPPLPDLGPIVPSEAAAYLSVLRPSGAQYVVLESVALGGN